MKYFLTTKREEEPDRHCRCIGYYDNFKQAEEMAKACAETLEEYGYYQYIIIEGFNQGWYPPAGKEVWYKFLKNGIKKIKKPKKYRNVCNFGIG